MSSQYGELWPKSVDQFGASQQISTGFASSLRYCTDGAQRRSARLCTMFGRLLGWYTIYTFLGLFPPTEFCHVQSSLSVQVQVLLSPLLAALCTARVQWASAKLAAWYKQWNKGTTAPRHFQQRAPPIYRWRPSRWA